MVQYYTHASLQAQLTHSPFEKESTASFTFKVLHLG